MRVVNLKNIWGYAAAAAMSILFVAVVSAALFISISGGLDQKPPESYAESRYYEGYLLTVRDGFIVIKSADSEEVVFSCNTPQDALSPYDKELLITGIYYESLDDARSAAADFCY